MKVSLAIVLSLAAVCSAGDSKRVLEEFMAQCKGAEAVAVESAKFSAGVAKCSGTDNPNLDVETFQAPLDVLLKMIVGQRLDWTAGRGGGRGRSPGLSGKGGRDGGRGRSPGLSGKGGRDGSRGSWGHSSEENDNIDFNLSLMLPGKALGNILGIVSGKSMGRKGWKGSRGRGSSGGWQGSRGGQGSSEETGGGYTRGRGSSGGWQGGRGGQGYVSSEEMGGGRGGPGSRNEWKGRRDEDVGGGPMPFDMGLGGMSMESDVDTLRGPRGGDAQGIEEIMQSLVKMLSRNKRATEEEVTDFKEKLKTQMTEEAMRQSNFTCAMKEYGMYDEDLKFNYDGMEQTIGSLPIKDDWVKEKFILVAKTCAMSVDAMPEEYFNGVADVAYAKGKMFAKCKSEKMTSVCLDYAMKNKLEAVFGPISTFTEPEGVEEAAVLTAAREVL